MEAIYERLMVLYPPAFRSRFGGEVLQFIRDERASGRRVRWTRVYADLVRSVVVQRTKEDGMRMKGAVIAFVVVGVVGGTLAIVGTDGGYTGFMVTGALIVFLGVLFAIATLVSRGGKGAEFDYAERPRRWWWAIAGLLGAAELFMGVGGLIDDPKKENAFALAIFAGFAALVFGGMKIRNRAAGNWMIAFGALPMLPFIWMVAPPLLALIVIVMALADNIRISRPKVA